MTDSRGRAVGRLCIGAGSVVFVLAVGALLLSGGTGLLFGSLGIAGIPIAVGLFVFGAANAGAGTAVKAVAGLLLVGAVAGGAMLLPVVQRFGLTSVVVLFGLVVVMLAGMATMNSQQLRRRGPLSIDNSKGYDGRTEDREWIPSDEEMDEWDGDDR